MVPLLEINPPENTVKHTEPSTKAVKDGTTLGTGTLFITTEDIRWISEVGDGMIVKYGDVTVFAVTNDEKYPEKSIIVKTKKEHEPDIPMNGDHDSDSDESDDDAEFEESEIRFEPPSSADFQLIYDLMAECNSFHPTGDDVDEFDDGVEEEEDEDEDEEMFANAEDDFC